MAVFVLLLILIFCKLGEKHIKKHLIKSKNVQKKRLMNVLKECPLARIGLCNILSSCYPGPADLFLPLPLHARRFSTDG